MNPRRLTLPSSGRAFGTPLKSNVRARRSHARFYAAFCNAWYVVVGVRLSGPSVCAAGAPLVVLEEAHRGGRLGLPVLWRPAHGRASLPGLRAAHASAARDVERSAQSRYARGLSMQSTNCGKHMSAIVRGRSFGRACSSALGSAAAPGPQAFEGASYRSRQAAVCGVAAVNPAINQRMAVPARSLTLPSRGTSTIRLRLLAAAPHVKR